MKYTYRVEVYTSNKTMAISAYTDDDIPYGVCTLNLEEYGVTPLPGYIFVPAYKISQEFLQNIITDLGDPEYKPLPFGMGPFKARMYLLKLRNDWPEKWRSRMIFEAKKTAENTWQVYGRLPEDDHEKMFVEFVSLATICLERESVLDTMIEAFEYVDNHSGEDGQISVLFRPKEKGGMA